MSASRKESKQENFLAEAVNEAKASLTSVIDRQAKATFMLMLRQTKVAEKILLEIQSELQNAPANESIEHQFFRLFWLGNAELVLHGIQKEKNSSNQFKPTHLLDALHLVDLEGPRREFPPIMCINIVRALDIVLRLEDDSKGEEVFHKRLSQFNDMLVHIAKHLKELPGSEKVSYDQEVKLFETICETYIGKHYLEIVPVFNKDADLKAIGTSFKVKTLATMKRIQVVISWDRTKSEEVLLSKLHTLYLIVILEKDLNNEAELKLDREKAINAFEIHSINDFSKQKHKELFIAFKELLEKVVGGKIKYKLPSIIKKSVIQPVDQPVNPSELKELIKTGEKIEVILNRLVRSNDSSLSFHAMILACKSNRYDLLDALMQKFTDLKDMGSTENIIIMFMQFNQAYVTSALYVEMARHLTKQKKTSQDKHLFLKKILNVLINPQFGMKIQIKSQLIINSDKVPVAIPYAALMTIIEELWPVKSDQTLEKQFCIKLMAYSHAEKEQKTTTPVETQQPTISIKQQYSESKMKFSQAKLPADLDAEYKAFEQLRATVAGICNSIDKKLKTKTLAKHQETINSYTRLSDVTSYTEQLDVYSKLKKLYLNLSDRLNLTDKGAQLAYVCDVNSYLEKLSTFQNKLATDTAALIAVNDRLNQWIQADAQSVEKLAEKIQQQQTAKEKAAAEEEKINTLKRKKRAQQRKANKAKGKAVGQGKGTPEEKKVEEPPVLLDDSQVTRLQKAPEKHVKTDRKKSKRAERRNRQKGTTALVTKALTTKASVTETPKAELVEQQIEGVPNLAPQIKTLTGPAFDEVPDADPEPEQPGQPMLGYSLFGNTMPSLPTSSHLVKTLGLK